MDFSPIINIIMANFLRLKFQKSHMAFCEEFLFWFIDDWFGKFTTLFDRENKNNFVLEKIKT